MGGSILSPGLAALALLPLLLQIVKAQISPCGPDTISVNIPEYPNIQETIPIPQDEWPDYTVMLIASDHPDLQITITEDPNSPSPKDLQPDSSVFELVYNDSSQPPGIFFVMKKGVNRDGIKPTADDDINTLQYKLACRDPTEPLDNYFHTVKIQITDRNDNAPHFEGVPYSITVDELTPIGTTVFSSISTTDLDNGSNKNVRYSMATATTSQFKDPDVFTLTPEYPSAVVLSKPLDYEAMVRQSGNASLTVFEMNITATDRAVQFPLSNWTYLYITIKDGDDLPPVFVYETCPSRVNKPCVTPKYSTTVQSGATPSEPLEMLPIPQMPDPTQTVVMKVRDGDTLGAAVICSISHTEPQGYENRFTVTTERINDTDEYQCSVFVTTPIFREDQKFLDVVIQATEQTVNARTEEAELRLDIIPTNGAATTPNTNTGLGPSDDTFIPSVAVGAAVGMTVALMVVVMVVVVVVVLWRRRWILPCAGKVEKEVSHAADNPALQTHDVDLRADYLHPCPSPSLPPYDNRTQRVNEQRISYDDDYTLHHYSTIDIDSLGYTPSINGTQGVNETRESEVADYITLHHYTPLETNDVGRGSVYDQLSPVNSDMQAHETKPNENGESQETTHEQQC